MLAGIKFEFDWEFKGADEQFRKAIELDPSLVEPRWDYAMFLASRGRLDEAFKQLSAARAVDPLSPSVADRTAAAYYYARQFDKALAEAKRAIELDPSAMSGYVGLGRVLNAMGRLVCLVDALLNLDPVAPAAINPAVPIGLEDVVMTALRKRPEQRYQTAADLGSALAAASCDVERANRRIATSARRWWRTMTTLRGRRVPARA